MEALKESVDVLAYRTLVAARELLDEPNKWARGYYAYDKSGKTCDPSDYTAICWCTIGAIIAKAEHVCGKSPMIFVSPVIERAISMLRGKKADWVEVGDWNDAEERTFEDVQRAFDEAIARLDKDGAP